MKSLNPIVYKAEGSVGREEFLLSALISSALSSLLLYLQLDLIVHRTIYPASQNMAHKRFTTFEAHSCCYAILITCLLNHFKCPDAYVEV
jgi:hypothetical protein